MSSVSASTLANLLLRKDVLDLHAYHVPESFGYIKLDAMENPYLLPSELKREIFQEVSEAPINRYPDPMANNLKQKIRDISGLEEGVGIMLGNGSDELIQLLALGLNKPGAVLLSVEPSFVMYRMIATFTGMRYVGVPLAEDFSLDMPAILAALRNEKPALTFLSFPNNPTGNLFLAEEIAQIIEESPGLVVLDEAYYAFARESFIGRLEDYPNLLLMRTFSKLGMAGLRLGFLAGGNAWLGQLEKLRLPYNVGILTQLVAGKLLDHHEVLLRQAEHIRMDREKIFQQLRDIKSVEVYQSEANFLLFRTMNANDVYAGLKKRGVLIKNLNGAHPLLQGCLRVTVGTPEENSIFIDALLETINQTA